MCTGSWRTFAAFPRAVADLLAAMEHMSDDERAAFGYRHHGTALRTYLSHLIAEKDHL